MFVLLVAAVLPLLFATNVAQTPCGLDVTEWFSTQLDLAEVAGDGWTTGSYTYNATLGETGLSIASGIESKITSDTVTLCGKCVRTNSLKMIAHGYVGGATSGSALYGSTFGGKGARVESDLDGVLIGQYTKHKAKKMAKEGETISLRDDTNKMCTLFQGEKGNMQLGHLFTGLHGDVFALSSLIAGPSGESMLPGWETSTGITLSTAVPRLLNNLAPSKMGRWLDLLAPEGTYTPSTEVLNADNLEFIPPISVKQAMRDMAEHSQRLTRMGTKSLEDQCNTFVRDSSDWATCSRWTMVLSSAKLTGLVQQETLRDSEITPRASPECTSAQMAFLVKLHAMSKVEDPCAPEELESFTSLLDDIIDACSDPNWAVVIRPFISVGNVMCNAQPLYTNVSGSECFAEAIKGFLTITNIQTEIAPICTPCAAEILTREKMDLGYEIMCSIPRVPKVNELSCLGVFNMTFGDTSIQKIPFECLVPLTARMGIPLGYQTEYVLPEYCQPIFDALATRINCCCRIFNDMMQMLGYRVGLEGLKCPTCDDAYAQYEVTVRGLDVAYIEETLSPEALQQIITDEIAHRVPAVLRDEFVRDIHTVPKNVRTDENEATITFEYQRMSDAVQVDFDEVVQVDDHLFEMEEFIMDSENPEPEIVITEVNVIKYGVPSSSLPSPSPSPLPSPSSSSEGIISGCMSSTTSIVLLGVSVLMAVFAF